MSLRRPGVESEFISKVFNRLEAVVCAGRVLIHV